MGVSQEGSARPQEGYGLARSCGAAAERHSGARRDDVPIATIVLEKWWSSGRLEEAARRRGSVTVPTAHAHPGDGVGGVEPPGLALLDRPLDLVDIGRVLGASANVERLGEGAPIRHWRDDLTLIREALSYARSVLLADLAILAPPGASEATGGRDVVGELPALLATGDQGWAEGGS